jgi:hypothetical protein
MRKNNKKIFELLDPEELSFSFTVSNDEMNDFIPVSKPKKKEKRKKINGNFVNIVNNVVYFEKDDEYINKWSFSFNRFENRVEQIVNHEWTVLPDEEYFKPYPTNNYKFPLNKRRIIWNVDNEQQFINGINQSVNCKNARDISVLENCGWKIIENQLNY